MTEQRSTEAQLSALRQAFDQSFAEAVSGTRPEETDFLAVRVAGDRYALRLSEIQSLHASRRVVSAPSELTELLGLAGFRGILTPVYDLARLIGYGAEPAAKWLVVVQHAAPIAFAFGGFDAHLRVGSSQVSASEQGMNAALRGAVSHGANALPILHLPSLVEGLAQRIKAFGSSQER